MVIAFHGKIGNVSLWLSAMVSSKSGIHKTFKWYSIVLSTSFPLAQLIHRSRFVFKNEALTIKIIATTMERSSLVTFLITVLAAAFRNMRTWEEFLIQIINVKSNFRRVSRSFASRENIAFIIGNVSICTLHTSQMFINFENLRVCLYFSTTFIFLYFGFLVVTLLLNISLAIRDGYQYVNDLVSCDLRVHFNSVRILQKIKGHILKLDDVVENFNKLFGWPLLLMLANEVLTILNKEFSLQKKTVIVLACYLLVPTVSHKNFVSSLPV